MRHTHYTVQGYDEEIPGMGGIPILQGQVTLDLIATNEAEAISKAQKLAGGRNWYRVSSVFEHDPDLEIPTQVSEPILQQLKDGELTLDRIQILEATGEIKILPSLASIGGNNGRTN
jgi:hypothetical protein